MVKPTLAKRILYLIEDTAVVVAIGGLTLAVAIYLGYLGGKP